MRKMKRLKVRFECKFVERLIKEGYTPVTEVTDNGSLILKVFKDNKVYRPKYNVYVSFN